MKESQRIQEEQAMLDQRHGQTPDEDDANFNALIRHGQTPDEDGANFNPLIRLFLSGLFFIWPVFHLVCGFIHR